MEYVRGMNNAPPHLCDKPLHHHGMILVGRITSRKLRIALRIIDRVLERLLNLADWRRAKSLLMRERLLRSLGPLPDPRETCRVYGGTTCV
jgi:hypothetical protein